MTQMSLLGKFVSPISTAIPLESLRGSQIFGGHLKDEPVWVARLPENIPSNGAAPLGLDVFFISADRRVFYQLKVSLDHLPRTAEKHPPHPLLTLTPNFASLALVWNNLDLRLLLNDPDDHERLLEIPLAGSAVGEILQDAAFYLYSDGEVPKLEGALRTWWTENAEKRKVTLPLLYLEDELLLAKPHMRVLKNRGFENVLHARTTSQALAILERTPDLQFAICDYELGEDKTGLDLAREIKRIRPDFRILFYTGSSPEVRGRLSPEELEEFDILDKPAEPGALERHIRAILKKS